MPSNAAKGREFEHRVKRLLEDAGFYVMRSAASKGVVDLIALRKDVAPLMVQCKMVKKHMTPALRVELYMVAHLAGTLALLATRHGPRAPVDFFHIHNDEGEMVPWQIPA